MLSSSKRHATRQLVVRRRAPSTRCFTHKHRCAEAKSTSAKPRKTDEVNYTSTTAVTGLLRKHAALEKSTARSMSAMKGRETRLRNAKERKSATTSDLAAPRLSPRPDQPHHDLATFIDHAQRTKPNQLSTVFKGTLYEYTVAEVMKAYDMTLRRVGKSNDRGIDLLGEWALPSGDIIRVLVQCKVGSARPAMVRELEGAYAGAPSGWQGTDVMVILAATNGSRGVASALQHSKLPMAFLRITPEGLCKHVHWNVTAGTRLVGVSVENKYSVGDGVESGAALQWLNEPWRSPRQHFKSLSHLLTPEKEYAGNDAAKIKSVGEQHSKPVTYRPPEEKATEPTCVGTQHLKSAKDLVIPGEESAVNGPVEHQAADQHHAAEHEVVEHDSAGIKTAGVDSAGTTSAG